MIEPDDEAAAEEAFVEGLDAVPGDSDAWDRPDVFLDVETLLEPYEAFAAEPPAESCSVPPGAALIPSELKDLDLPPIAGGTDEVEPFTPSPAECADDRAHLDEVEPLYG
jgi:hypothetical protein